MDIQEYIASGVLELYVAGSLTEEENKAVHEMVLKHPELLTEIQEIEKTVSILTSSVAPKNNEPSFKNLLIKMIQEKETETKVIPINTPKANWTTYSGWAASVLIGSALLYSVMNSSSLFQEIKTIRAEKQNFKQKLESSETNLEANKILLAAIRNKDIISVTLQGQDVSPESYAKVYWNKTTKTMYVDVQGLPDPPEGKVYQLWSLKLNPLTPSSLGTLDDFITDTNKIFTVNNPNQSQAFGITLEPKGGSKSPTLEQLYTLGVVNS